MRKFSVTILGIITVQLIFGTLASSEDYRLSEEKIILFRDIARQWLEVINSEKNPCEDFYDYVCSEENFPRNEYTTFTTKLRDVLNEKPEIITKAEEKYLKYSNCNEFIIKDEIKSFIETFKFENSIGSWPGFEERWDDSKFNFSLAIAEMSSYNHPVIFKQVLDYDDNLIPTLQIEMQSQIIPIEDNKVEIKKYFEDLGVKNPDDVLTDGALFQKIYNEVVESLESFTDKRMNFSELKDLIPEIDWDKQIEMIYGEKLPNDHSVLVNSYKELQKICSAIAKLSPKVIANYFFFEFAYDIRYEMYPQAKRFFKPVVKQALMKHIYDKQTREMVKGMYLTTLKVLQDQNVYRNFERKYNSSVQIAKLSREDIFELSNEEELENEFKDVSTNNNECLENYHRLQKISNKLSGKEFFNREYSLTTKVANVIDDDLVDLIPFFLREPSPFMFGQILYSMMSTLLTFSYTHLKTIHPPTENCFADGDNIEIVLASQLILKAFVEWTKDYPHFVQEENKILQEYDLTVEKLLAIWTAKMSCGKEIQFPVVPGFANSLEFSQIYNCTAGSKMNRPQKCSFV